MKKTLITLMALASVAMGEYTYDFTVPASDASKNGGSGNTNVDAAITKWGNTDGAYMFNNGGQCGTNATNGEGFLTYTDNVGTLTLAPREGAGGSGEAIVMSAPGFTLNQGDAVGSITLSITSSASSAGITGNVTLTLAVIEKNATSDTWSVLGEKATGSLTIGQGATLTLDLGEGLAWNSANHKVVAVIDNCGKELNGSNGNLYTVSGIAVSANIIPEPATATLSLLALAGLAARRRRR